MNQADIDSLLAEVSPDAPCGDNLEYDAAFVALEQDARGKPEQQIGDTVIPAEEPDWKALETRALELLQRSRDLRVLLILLRALVRRQGYGGLRDGLILLRGLVEQRWDTLHPQLDPDDEYDPTMRVNILASLCDEEGMLRALRQAPLVSAPALGRFGLRDLAIATGDLQAPPSGEEPPPALSTIEAAFQEASAESLQATEEAARAAREHVLGIEAFVTDQVGSGRAQSLAALSDLLRDAERALRERLARRGLAPDGAGDLPGAGGAAGEAPASGGSVGAEPAGPSWSGAVNTREDALRVLERVIAYYRRAEPSSPVPVLLERATRLATMDFVAMMQNIAPDAMGQVDALRGPQESPESE